MKVEVTKRTENQVRAEYPITDDTVPGWFFRLREISAGVWRAEATDLWGRQISTTGTDEQMLIKDCVGSALKMQEQILHSQAEGR